MRVEDAFHIASINKTFTAVAVLRLVDEHKLSLSATLKQCLGEAVAQIPNAEKITVAQLLDHSSGIYATNNDMDYLTTVIGPKADPARVWTPAELIALASKDRSKPSGEPGQGHYYADTNYILLGMIVEGVHNANTSCASGYELHLLLFFISRQGRPPSFADSSGLSSGH
jgi:D-alanyl-D-alanine carboxypeptidase